MQRGSQGINRRASPFESRRAGLGEVGWVNRATMSFVCLYSHKSGGGLSAWGGGVTWLSFVGDTN